LADTESWDIFLRELAARYGLPLFDPKPFLCDASLCHAVSAQGEVLYFNETHVNLVGVDPIAKAMAHILVADNL
jgi:hypothetical protein